MNEHFHNATMFNQDELCDMQVKEKSDRQVQATIYNLAPYTLLHQILSSKSIKKHIESHKTVLFVRCLY